jgi:hypothetical protein
VGIVGRADGIFVMMVDGSAGYQIFQTNATDGFLFGCGCGSVPSQLIGRKLLSMVMITGHTQMLSDAM